MTRRDSYIGTPVERIEDLRFLRGRGQYIDDLNRNGLLHAAVVRSAVAHGRIRSLDTAAALALPGVRAVITARTPGSANAAAVSRLRMRPCATALRTTAACSKPLRFRSSIYWPRPLRKRRSSIRSTGVPI